MGSSRKRKVGKRLQNVTMLRYLWVDVIVVAVANVVVVDTLIM